MTNGYTPYVGLLLPPSLQDGGAARAITLLTAYFAPLTGTNGGYTGGRWDFFDPSRTRSASANVFTPDDLLACSLLSAEIGGRAAYDLLVAESESVTALLSKVRPDQDLAEIDAFGKAFEPVRLLYQKLAHTHGIGETRATKLIARKRPRLVPIVDGVVKHHVFENRPHQWEALHGALRNDDRALHNRLVSLRTEAGLPDAVSALRIFDVLAWMEGSGNAKRILGEREDH